MVRALLITLVALAVLPACGERGDPSLVPYPIATDARRSFPAVSPAVAEGAPLGRLRCLADGPSVGVHLEVFIAGQVVLVPSGVGLGPRCSYPVITRDPTGVLLVRRGAELTLGDLFAEWGVALAATHIGPASGTVSVWVDGRPVGGDPARVPLRRHAEIVVAIGRPAIVPHPGYTFAPGL